MRTSELKSHLEAYQSQLSVPRFVHRRDGFTFIDTVFEAVRGLSVRPARLMLTVLVVSLGIGGLVTAIGLGQTGAGQLSARFDAAAATWMTVRPQQDDQGAANAPTALPVDSADSAVRLNGVAAACLFTDLTGKIKTVQATPVVDPGALPQARPDVIAATPTLLEVVGGRITQGRFFDTYHDSAMQRVAVLGTTAARALDVTSVRNEPAVFVNGIPFAVIGILDNPDRHPELDTSVIIPQSTAIQAGLMITPDELDIRIDIGAGDLVAQNIAIQINPSSQENYVIAAPPSVNQFRDAVTSDVNSVFVILCAVVILAGALVIAVVTSLAVSERRGEIGLRRALGATKGEIGDMVIAECVVTGLIGGLTGTALGVLVVVIASAAKQWTPAIDTRLVVAAIVGGVVVGLLAGLVPAVLAARLEPSEALREGT